jgi:hypothetical protein
MTSQQEREYETYQAKGLVVKEKSPAAGAVLGLLPGCGSFYAHAWGAGVVDFLLWPVSVFWDPFSGYQGARTINYYATKADVDGKMHKELSYLDDQLVAGLVTKEQYVQKKHDITNQYGGN